MTAKVEKVDHAKQNAQGWAETITALVAALECDFDRLEELRDERANLAETLKDMQDDTSAFSPSEKREAKKALTDWDADHGDELKELTEAATVDGDLYADADSVRERIQESPLSVEVRDGWRTPGGNAGGNAEEFCILLSTGGPALRIMGELDEHNQPTRAWLEYQDWGTPWTHHYVEGLGDTLVTFCQQFYLGE